MILYYKLAHYHCVQLQRALYQEVEDIYSYAELKPVTISILLSLVSLFVSLNPRLSEMVVEVVETRQVFSQRVTYIGCQPQILQSSMSSSQSIGLGRYRGYR